MQLNLIAVIACGLCGKPCDKVEVVKDGSFYVVQAVCHGKSDFGKVAARRVRSGKQIILQPFNQ